MPERHSVWQYPRQLREESPDEPDEPGCRAQLAEENGVEEAAGGLDGILSGASSSILRRFVPGTSGVRMALGLARNHESQTGRAARAPGQLAAILRGTSDVAPAPKDRRFADPAWQTNPFLRRAMQAYLVAGASASALVDDARLGWRDEERMRFIVDNLVEAASPSDNPVTSPAMWKSLVDTGGLSLARGARNFLHDMRTSPRVPAMVDLDAFEVGENLSVTPGEVVFRDEVFELIHYRPQTARVRRRPLLVVPPTINKFYVLDLAPGRSLVEHLVGQGQQVFMISWRNPDRRHADWDLDTYGAAVLAALTEVEAITRTDATALMGVCSGGIIASLVLAHLAATGDLARICAWTHLVTMLDQSRRNVAGALLDEKAAAVATAKSRAQGYLDGRSLAEVFAWMRPTDLIWGYWVNNYLLGRTPPAFDILYWNSDATRMSAGLHADFVTVAKDNSVVNRSATMLGSDADVSAVDVDGYVVSAVADRICPWRSCYSTTRLVGGDIRFVLSSGGHIAALVNPVGSAKSSYRASDPGLGQDAGYPADPDAWLESAEEHQDSWWTDYSDWLGRRVRADEEGADHAGPSGHPHARRRAGAVCLRRLSPLVEEPGSGCARSASAGSPSAPRCASASPETTGPTGRDRSVRHWCCATASGPASTCCSPSSTRCLGR